MTALPAGLPVTSMDLTSAFGVRADPFTHRRALHPGQDFRGAVGGPIMAAGVGKVIHAGWLAGYGKAVMIDHGYHLVSLYGHMSRIFVQDGHFEVRLNGRSINPWPLMEMNLVR
jgi:murein DD-endopeptidase MepM/ murein hydrolase activator NlpD